MDGALHDLVAAIYAGAFEYPFERFKEDALALVMRAVPFTSAVWGTGVMSTNSILAVATVNLPPERLVDYALNWQEQDFVRATALARPGTAVRIEDIMPLDAYRDMPVYRDYAAPSLIEHSLAAASADPGVDLVELVCLFRADRAAPFSDAQRATLELLMPHLGRAWQHRQILHAVESNGAPSSPVDSRGYAVVDRDGLVQAANQQFTSEVCRHEGAWSGPYLPDALRRLVVEGRAHGRYAGMSVQLSGGGGRHLLTLAVPRLAADLTMAEMRVAELYASGVSSSEIAATIRVSRSTVRNQIAAIYRKLDIHSKTELARRMPVALTSLVDRQDA